MSMLALLLALIVSPAQAQPQPRPQPAAPEGCVRRELTITESTRLDPNCRYLGPTRITGSNLVLDCAGATLDGEYRTRTTLLIGPDQPVENVELRNCVVTGGRRNGITIGRTQTYAAAALQRGSREPDPAAYARKVTLRQVTVRRSGGVGIYVLAYSRDTAILDSTIEENSNAGIYLSHHTSGTRIADSRLIGNGKGETSGIPDALRGFREAIAVDSAAGNVIENNRLIGNQAGGIFLYRNCGEGSMDPARVRERPASARNIIRGNTIERGRTGIWVASRQDARIACTMALDPAQGVFMDAAPDNQVIDNRISGVAVGIQVADDGNVVRGNEIAASGDCLRLGSPERQRLGRPVAALVVRDNRCRSGQLQVAPGTGFARGGDPRG